VERAGGISYTGDKRMTLTIKHLLHYRWNGPSIGIRMVSGKFSPLTGLGEVHVVIIPIPKWFSTFLIFLSRNRKSYPGEFSI
jgi:hypothetical protein